MTRRRLGLRHLTGAHIVEDTADVRQRIGLIVARAGGAITYRKFLRGAAEEEGYLTLGPLIAARSSSSMRSFTMRRRARPRGIEAGGNKSHLSEGTPEEEPKSEEPKSDSD